ncbi:hypothetical protein [Sphingomonas spermidinifaciens]|uniref:hypothetical protein n=1 Tax=Sphingomonas spermidinifaciens TaxID=1141889 RepID=UPI001FEC81EB|nr:hypothetical protein [Sphingomonas spermidinifaciens]
MFRLLASAALLLSGSATAPLLAADTAPFDLQGPDLRIRVTRGNMTLPIAEVPELSPGDRIEIAADLPEDQRARFVLVSAFLSGATNPPPRDWIRSAETWKRKDKDRILSLTVPKGARQVALFLVPQTGGAEGTIAGAIRGKPGEFVRALQAMNRASLDRSRLDAFVAAVRAEGDADPAQLRRIAPTLAKSLSIKLNAECVDKVIENQVACLLENRDALVLADVHSSSLAETLAGAPTNLALQLSYTREAGFGYYSQYIAVVRDIARLFGAFGNPQFRYLPALGIRQGDRLSLLLNAAPSFAKPKSVLAAALPAIGADSPPRLRAAGDAPLCGADPDLVLPVEGAPLVFSTAFARDMTLRIGTADTPVRARADRGGYVLESPIAVASGGSVEARLRGRWGFDALDGPAFRLQFPDDRGWAAADGASLVVGRDESVEVRGTAPACVTGVTMRVGDGPAQTVAFEARGERALALKLPLKDVRPGTVAIEVRQHGRATPATLSIKAYREASRIDAVKIHAGDAAAELSGQRLDLVERVQIGALDARPAGLTRDARLDRLRVEGSGAAPEPGGVTARVALSDGRTLSVPVTVRAPRIRVALIDRSVRPGAADRLTVADDGGEPLLPASGQLRFSIRAVGGSFAATDAIEVAAPQGDPLRIAMGPQLALQGRDVLVATLDPAALGPAAFGPLRFRVVHGDEASDWQPLAQLARLPAIESVRCGEPRGRCTVTGDALFLIDAIAATRDFADPVKLPDGFTGGSIEVPAPAKGPLFARLRDAPAKTLTLPVGDGAGTAQ